jgi:hypothetical protein
VRASGRAAGGVRRFLRLLAEFLAPGDGLNKREGNRESGQQLGLQICVYIAKLSQRRLEQIDLPTVVQPNLKTLQPRTNPERRTGQNPAAVLARRLPWRRVRMPQEP